MSEKCSIIREAYKLDFLKKKISAPYPSIEYWLTIPEFLEVMLEKVEHGETIDDTVVLPVMEKIYNDFEQQRKAYGGIHFNYSLARSAIKKLRKKL